MNFLNLDKENRLIKYFIIFGLSYIGNVPLIELKDKVQKIEGNDEIPILQSNRTKEEALSALEVLGYPRRQSEKVIDNILQSTPDSSIEEVIKIALNKL